MRYAIQSQFEVVEQWELVSTAGGVGTIEGGGRRFRLAAVLGSTEKFAQVDHHIPRIQCGKGYG